MKVGIYIRVSSAEQAEEGYSIGAQEEKLKSFCKVKDWLIHETYIDPGFTGSNLKRPAMQKMLDDVKTHKIDIIVVYKLDRFTRSQKDCINLLEDVLLPNRCDFVSISENFDTSTPYGRAMIGILSIFAQLERETIRERTVMGRIERAKTGLYSGNANLPIGYDYVDGRLVVNKYEAMQIKEVFELYIGGSSITKIIDTLNEKGYTTKHGGWKHLNTIKRVLVSKLYYGELKYKGEYYIGQHTPIITKEKYDKVQEIHRIYSECATGHRKTPFMSTHLLTGFLWCGECGARMHAKTITKNDFPSYICYSVSKTAKKYVTNPSCKATPRYCFEIEDFVLSSIKELDFTKINELKACNNDIIDEDRTNILKLQLCEVDKKLNKLMDLYLMDSISKDSVSSKFNELEKQRDLTEKELIRLKSVPKKEKTRDVIKKINKLEIIMEQGTLQQKKAVLSSLIDSVTILKSEIIIKWTFV